MPTYSYECKKCNHAFDIKQRMTEDKLKTCPECKEEELQTVITTGSFIALKGGGWFKDGY